MYVVPIILIISTAVIDRWMLLVIMIATMFVVCIMMSSVTRIIVIMHLRTVLLVWIAREWGSARYVPRVGTVLLFLCLFVFLVFELYMG